MKDVKINKRKEKNISRRGAEGEFLGLEEKKKTSRRDAETQGLRFINTYSFREQMTFFHQCLQADDNHQGRDPEKWKQIIRPHTDCGQTSSEKE